MKALFTKDCLDWVGHLIIQATIWKQRSKLKAKCGLLRKKLLVCVCCKYCCMRVYFKAMSCFVPVKQKQNDQGMHYILLIWHLIILNVCEGTLVWLNLGQVSFPKVPVQKKKKRKKVRVRSCDQAQVMLLTSSTRSAKGGWGSLRLHWTTATRMQRWRCR